VIPQRSGLLIPEPRSTFQGPELFGRTIGIIDFGGIGQEIARLAGGFGMRILVHDPFVSESIVDTYGAQRVALLDLAASSDIVTVAANVTLGDPRTGLSRGAARDAALCLLHQYGTCRHCRLRRARRDSQRWSDRRRCVGHLPSRATSRPIHNWATPTTSCCHHIWARRALTSSASTPGRWSMTSSGWSMDLLRRQVHDPYCAIRPGGEPVSGRRDPSVAEHLQDALTGRPAHVGP
jgi:hypothetical protein